jgi:uncharacterized Fe-S cluster-containing radical SAM superfamily protein
VIDVSVGCNTDCVFCLRNQVRRKVARPSRLELAPLHEFLALSKALGVTRIELGGDEPTMLRKRLLKQVVLACARHGLAEIRLVTNGVKLGEGSFVDELVSFGVGVFLLPVYGSTAKIHDAITQRPGSFVALGRALRRLARHEGVRVLCHLVLLRQNQADVARTREWVQERGHSLLVVPLHQGHAHVDFAPLVPLRSLNARERRSLDAIAPEYEVSLNYNLLAGELNFGIGHGDAMSTFVLQSLARLGMPTEMRAKVERGLARNPLYRRPLGLLGLWRLAERGDFADPRFAAYLAPSAAALFALAKGALARGDAAETRDLLGLVLGYLADDDESRRAKESATRLLESLPDGSPSRGGKNARATSRITHSITK